MEGRETSQGEQFNFTNIHHARPKSHSPSACAVVFLWFCAPLFCKGLKRKIFFQITREGEMWRGAFFFFAPFRVHARSPPFFSAFCTHQQQDTCSFFLILSLSAQPKRTVFFIYVLHHCSFGFFHFCWWLSVVFCCWIIAAGLKFPLPHFLVSHFRIKMGRTKSLNRNFGTEHIRKKRTRRALPSVKRPYR